MSSQIEEVEADSTTWSLADGVDDDYIVNGPIQVNSISSTTLDEGDVEFNWDNGSDSKDILDELIFNLNNDIPFVEVEAKVINLKKQINEFGAIDICDGVYISSCRKTNSEFECGEEIGCFAENGVEDVCSNDKIQPEHQPRIPDSAFDIVNDPNYIPSSSKTDSEFECEEEIGCFSEVCEDSLGNGVEGLCPNIQNDVEGPNITNQQTSNDITQPENLPRIPDSAHKIAETEFSMSVSSYRPLSVT
ncbi:hypothetical protein JTB14_025720 [Gonioctena quinquepunctata]|nr:hypothetical protein JTB14_025720 [Gonioctena quinquepunctata]